MLRKYIGNRQFYTKVIILMLPILLQNGITTFVNMLDNIMVGRVGQVEMTGVSVANSLIMVFNLMVFGAISGAGIFGAQFVGKKDTEGVRDALRFKWIISAVFTVFCCAILFFFKEPLINLFLKGEGDILDAEASLAFGRQYVDIMMIGFLPYALSQCYASTLRENGQTLMPMIGGVIAVAVNCILNWVLIFGKMGLPQLGVAGAAIATVISRFVELAVLVIFTHCKKYDFIVGIFKHFRVPKKLVSEIMKRGMHLVINETLWSVGMTFITQCYSLRGLDVVAANTITNTFFNVFSVTFMAVGVAAGIILGQELGAGETDTVYDDARKLITFSVLIGIVFAGALALFSGIIPRFYVLNDETRELTRKMILLCALVMPLDAFTHCAYFTIRSGGKVLVTLIFDSGVVWLINLPVAYILAHYTSMPILPMYLIVYGLNFIKCIIGFIFVKRKKWITKIV